MSLKQQILDANALGVKNLQAKGVTVPGDSTTYNIMEKIATIPAGGGSSLNFIYGEQEPPVEDGKIWIKTKTEKPKRVNITNQLQQPLGGKIFTPLKMQWKETAEGSAIATVGTDFYVFGGYVRSNKIAKISNKNNVYSIEELPVKLPKGLWYASACAIGTNIYIVGGKPDNYPHDAVYKFDTVSQTCDLYATLPWGVRTPGLCAVGTTLYIIGGTTGDHQDNYFYTRKICTLDTTQPAPAQIYEKTAQLTDDLRCGTAKLYGDKIYIMGFVNKKAIGIYDYKKDTFTFSQDCLTAPYLDVVGDLFNNCLYINSPRGYLNKIIEINLDTFTEQITTLPAVIFGGGDYGKAAGVVLSQNKMLVFGPSTASNQGSFCMFNMQMTLNKDELLVYNSLSLDNTINLLDSSEISYPVCVSNVYFGNMDNIAEPCLAYLGKNGKWELI